MTELFPSHLHITPQVHRSHDRIESEERVGERVEAENG